MLPCKRLATAPIGKSMLQYKVNPLFQQGWGTVPVKGVLPDHDVMGKQQFLFPFYINMKIRITFIEVMKGNTFDILDTIPQLQVNP